MRQATRLPGAESSMACNRKGLDPEVEQLVREHLAEFAHLGQDALCTKIGHLQNARPHGHDKRLPQQEGS
ncbi:MAG: hypothetical protein H0W86_03695 [Armatimonadetes bacterium]|nr:hypothetical protein [Armatimonadota bacterium]